MSVLCPFPSQKNLNGGECRKKTMKKRKNITARALVTALKIPGPEAGKGTQGEASWISTHCVNIWTN